MFKAKFNEDLKTWHGQKVSPIFHPNMSLGKGILYVLSQRPKLVAQISDDSGVQLTNEMISKRIIRIAMNLQKLGCKNGDMIGVVCKNSENLSSVIFGSSVIGAPVNTLDPTFEKSDISHMFLKTKPKIVFCDFDNINVVQESLLDAKLNPEIITLIQRVDGFKFVEDLILEVTDELSFIPPELNGDGSKLPAMVVCSSGTTGLSKGISLSHAQLLNFVVDTGRGVFSYGITLCFSSLYWLSGVSSLITGVFTASTRVITTDPFTPELAFKIIEKYEVTMVVTPPSQLGLLLHSPIIKKADLSSIRLYFCGGSTVPQHFLDQMNSLLKNGISCNGYGMTEIGGGIAGNITGKKSSVGFLMANIDVKIISEEGVSLGKGEDGEICAKSFFSFLGYYGDDNETKSILDSEGWLHSGDIGHFDEDNYLFLVDRKKDIMKYKNYQISPSELEELIGQHSGVSAVSVVGIPDDISTDLPAAVIVRMENSNVTEEEIYDLVAKDMSDFKKLRGGVFFVEKLPMTISGKIQKNKVKELAIKLFNNKVSPVTISGQFQKNNNVRELAKLFNRSL